jgi:hypothetical protein
MSYSIEIAPRAVRVLVHVFRHDIRGPPCCNIPTVCFRVEVCQTTTIRELADALSHRWNQIRHDTGHWQVGRILDGQGDEFDDPKETVWGALELLPICIVKACPEHNEVMKEGRSQVRGIS